MAKSITFRNAYQKGEDLDLTKLRLYAAQLRLESLPEYIEFLRRAIDE